MSARWVTGSIACTPLRTQRPRLWPSLSLFAFLLTLVAELISASAAGAQRSSPIEPAAVTPDDPTPTRVFREFSKRTAPGLPQSTVMGIFQDRRGVLWLATLDGLGTFDGTEVRPVERQPNAPVQGAVFSMAEDRDGHLIVGGSRTIYRFDGETWQSFDAPNMTFDLLEDDDGRLLRIDNAGNLLRQGDGETWLPEELGELGTAAEVLGPAVAIRHDGESLWLAGRQGIVRRMAGTFERMPAAPEEITAFLLRKDGSLVVGTREASLFLLPPGADTWQRLEIRDWQGGWFRSLEEDRRGRLWAGGNAGGVAFGSIDRPLRAWGIDHGLARGGVLDILADREGSVWFSLNGRGVHQWVGESWSHRMIWGADRLDPRLQVFGIRGTADGRGFWAAVFGRGVWKWDGQTFFEIEEGPFEDARVAFEPAPGTLWIGARFGAWELSADGTWRQFITLENGFVWDFERGPDGRWWAATSAAGLYVEGDGDWTPAAFNEQLPDRAVRDIHWRGDQLWAGTMNGLAVFESGERLEIDGADQLPPAISGVLEKGDEMWLAGVGGIGIVGPDGVRRIEPEDGLPGTTIYSLAEDSTGTIWLGGASGVARQHGDGWQVFGTEDGLFEGECNHQALLTSPDGSVYVGTMATLARFDGGTPALEAPVLELEWTSRPRGHMPADARSARLEWRAPWLLPQPIEYRLRVPRLDHNWTEPRRERFLQLDNLGPGGWRVELQARFVGEKTWGETIIAGWSIAPFWWETRLFAAFALLAMIAGVVLVVRWRTGRLRRRAAELERSVEEAVARLRVLSGLLPICSVCKKVRDDDGYWQQIERYIDRHSEAVFSHGLCPECVEEHYADYSGKDADANSASLPG